MKIRPFIISVIILSCSVSHAQTIHRQKLSTNFGLASPQPGESLPASRVPVILPQRKEKMPAVTGFRQTGKNSWAIVDGWELCEADDFCSDKWYNAVVPGTVLTTLVRQGIYPDPYFGLNNLAIPDDLCRKEWWYRCSFSVPAEAEGKKTAELIFEGINYKADIWLNGVKLGNIKGAFTRGKFDITKHLSDTNELYVRICPPANPGIPHEQSPTAGGGLNGGALCLDGPTFICSEGWDWIPGVRDRNIGIWQDVILHVSDGITIGDTRIITDLPLPDVSYSDISIRSSVSNHLDTDKTVTLAGKIAELAFSKDVTIRAGETACVEISGIRLDDPELWMPNGYGDQYLYTLSLQCGADGTVSDAKDIPFGIREFTYEITADTKDVKGLRIEYNPLKDNRPGGIFNNRMLRDTVSGVQVPSLKPDLSAENLDIIPDDGMGPYLVIKVNGVRIFCRGGNWGMDDMMKNVSREHLEPYFKLHKDANFNMIRNWTGASTSETFYRLCDEYGMLVWNDFWISTEGFNLNPLDEDLFMSNAADVVRRFRNHPSIAIWCPRNEGYATESLERRLSELISEEDGTRHYHPNSRHCDLRPSGPWHYYRDAGKYYRDDAYGFNTELGSPSVPTAATMRKMMPEADLWPISDTWHYHDLLNGLSEYVAAVGRLYGEPENIDDFCKKVQFINYDSYRAMFESWNSRMWNNTSGVLLWMSHPAWPSVEWQTYSWDYETFGSYYGAKKACEPVHVQMNLHDRKIVLLNTAAEALGKVEVSMTCHDLNGKVLCSRSEKGIGLPAGSKAEVFTADLPSDADIFIVRLKMKDQKGNILSLNDYIMTGNGKSDFIGLNDLPCVSLRGKRLQPGAGGKERVEISNPSKYVALNLKLNVINSESGEIMLPAYFSEGYFHLLPGEKKVVEFSCGTNGDIGIEGYNVNKSVIK